MHLISNSPPFSPSLPVVVCQRNAQPVLSYIGEAVGPLAATADGNFLFAGSILGRIYAWEVLFPKAVRPSPTRLLLHTCIGCLFIGLSWEELKVFSHHQSVILLMRPLAGVRRSRGRVSAPSHPLTCIGLRGGGPLLCSHSPPSRRLCVTLVRRGCFPGAQVSTGRLLRSWAAHYKAVTSLRLSDDDSLLISASDDASVHVTPLIRQGGGSLLGPRCPSLH